jgi:hypothetical protein
MVIQTDIAVNTTSSDFVLVPLNGAYQVTNHYLLVSVVLESASGGVRLTEYGSAYVPV